MESLGSVRDTLASVENTKSDSLDLREASVSIDEFETTHEAALHVNCVGTYTGTLRIDAW